MAATVQAAGASTLAGVEHGGMLTVAMGSARGVMRQGVDGEEIVYPYDNRTLCPVRVSNRHLEEKE